MKSLSLTVKATQQLIFGRNDFYERDIEGSVKGFIPGEWIMIEAIQRMFFAFVNPFVVSGPIVRVVTSEFSVENSSEDLVAREVISKLLGLAIEKREMFQRYDIGRLVYGDADELPGLIVDEYDNCIIVQINTAGIDRYRGCIKENIEKSRGKQVYFLDNPKYRASEVLPVFENKIPNEVNITENGFKYSIPKKQIQKIGYYFDHRDNRTRMETLIRGLKIPKDLGLDLFSYVGSWGLHLLRSGFDHVDFVDQGNMENATLENLDNNGFSGRGSFVRADVFKFLDQAISKGKKYNIVVSDPPAFSKKESNLKQAIKGYEKLHRKCFEVLMNGSLYIAASCTHGITLEGFDKTVQSAAAKNNVKLHVVDIGIQGKDHPMKSLNSSTTYIKYIAYIIRK